MTVSTKADPVQQRFTMTEEQFNKLSKEDQQRVLEAKLMDQMIKPMLDKATSRAREANSERLQALKGEK